MTSAEKEWDIAKRRQDMRKKSQERYTSIIKLAGFELEKTWELANQYWPDHPTYDFAREPWWLFKTSFGCIRIGHRKRVIEIDWTDTGHHGKITEEQSVTSEETFVHAWSDAKAVEYLTTLYKILQARPR